MQALYPHVSLKNKTCLSRFSLLWNSYVEEEQEGRFVSSFLCQWKKDFCGAE